MARIRGRIDREEVDFIGRFGEGKSGKFLSLRVVAVLRFSSNPAQPDIHVIVGEP
jgi:hypothetical protein